MKQYQYKIDDINKMLFTELVLAMMLDEKNEDIFHDEIVKRLKFCSFEEKMIKELISYELVILKSTNKNFLNLLVNTKWWLSDIDLYINDSSKKLLSLPFEQYSLYYKGNISSNALTNSELVSIMDEADFIIKGTTTWPQSIVKESIDLLDIKNKASLRREFVDRILYIYDRFLNIKYEDKNYEKAMRFLINELHIIYINKYGYNDKNNQWLPYTNGYFDMYEF